MAGVFSGNELWFRVVWFPVHFSWRWGCLVFLQIILELWFPNSFTRGRYILGVLDVGDIISKNIFQTMSFGSNQQIKGAAKLQNTSVYLWYDKCLVFCFFFLFKTCFLPIEPLFRIHPPRVSPWHKELRSSFSMSQNGVQKQSLSAGAGLRKLFPGFGIPQRGWVLMCQRLRNGGAQSDNVIRKPQRMSKMSKSETILYFPVSIVIITKASQKNLMK